MTALLVASLLQAQPAQTQPVRQVRLDVFSGERKLGVATYTLSARKGGGRVTRLRMALLNGGTTDEISQTGPDGAMVRSENRTVQSKATSREVVTYDARGGATIVRDGAKFTVEPPKGTRKDPSEAWFRPKAPKPGEWAKFQSLNVRKRVWEEVKVKYVGKEGKGHLVQQSRNMDATTRFVLDDVGMPIAIESGETRWVRR